MDELTGALAKHRKRLGEIMSVLRRYGLADWADRDGIAGVKLAQRLAGHVGGPVAEQPGEPAGPFRAERARLPSDGTVDGSGVADGVAGAAHCGLPLLDAGGALAGDGVEALLAALRQGAQVAGVDEGAHYHELLASGFAAGV